MKILKDLKEKLHIKDSIDYERFQVIHKKQCKKIF